MNIKKIIKCERCGKQFDVSHVIIGMESCPYCGYLNWVKEETDN